MTRRWALAGAFLLTSLFGFFVVAYGAESGLFGWTNANPAASSTSMSEPMLMLDDQPSVITEYVYIDEAPPADEAEQAAFHEHDDDEYGGEWDDDDGDDHDDDGDDHDDDDHDDGDDH